MHTQKRLIGTLTDQGGNIHLVDRSHGDLKARRISVYSKRSSTLLIYASRLGMELKRATLRHASVHERFDLPDHLNNTIAYSARIGLPAYRRIERQFLSNSLGFSYTEAKTTEDQPHIFSGYEAELVYNKPNQLPNLQHFLNSVFRQFETEHGIFPMPGTTRYDFQGVTGKTPNAGQYIYEVREVGCAVYVLDNRDSFNIMYHVDATEPYRLYYNRELLAGRNIPEHFKRVESNLLIGGTNLLGHVMSGYDNPRIEKETGLNPFLHYVEGQGINTTLELMQNYFYSRHENFVPKYNPDARTLYREGHAIAV